MSDVQKPNLKIFDNIENYIYLYHTKTFIILPAFPTSLTESSSANFNSTPILSRQNPIFTYSNSTSRSFQVTLDLHRDMMQQINKTKSNIKIDDWNDYVDILTNQIQGAVLPKYSDAIKMVNPPLVAIRFGNDTYCKGIIQGGLSITRSGPILAGNKYAQVQITFTITEIDPFEATVVQRLGSFRRDTNTLESTYYSTDNSMTYQGQKLS